MFPCCSGLHQNRASLHLRRRRSFGALGSSGVNVTQSSEHLNTAGQIAADRPVHPKTTAPYHCSLHANGYSIQV